MDAVLTIDGKTVGFRANALTPRHYRNRVKRDIIRDLNGLRTAYNKAVKAKGLKKPAEDASKEEKEAYKEALQDAEFSVMNLEAFEDMAFIMARQYDQTIPDTIEKWLEGFETFSIYQILPEILKLWGMNQETTSTAKNG